MSHRRVNASFIDTTFVNLPPELNQHIDGYLYRHSTQYWKQKFSKIITFFKKGYVKPKISRSYFLINNRIVHMIMTRIKS